MGFCGGYLFDLGLMSYFGLCSGWWLWLGWIVGCDVCGSCGLLVVLGMLVVVVVAVASSSREWWVCWLFLLGRRDIEKERGRDTELGRIKNKNILNEW